VKFTDNRDRQIIDELRKDARISIRELASKTKQKRSTIHDRISKLVSEGVIEKFTVKLDNKKADEQFIAFVFIAAAKEPKSIFDHNIVKEIFRISGEFDILLKIKCKDISEFNEFVLQLKKANEIKKFSTTICIDTMKEEV